jgi:hypothetical protein
MIVVAHCLVLTDWGISYAMVPDRPINPKVAARALAPAGVLIAFGMFTSGSMKPLHWINFDLSSSGFASWFFRPYCTPDRTFLLAPVVLRILPELFKIVDYTAVAFELSAFFFLFAGRVGRRVWLLVAAIFHRANLLLLNIDFYFHTLVYRNRLGKHRLDCRDVSSTTNCWNGYEDKRLLVSVIAILLYPLEQPT